MAAIAFAGGDPRLDAGDHARSARAGTTVKQYSTAALERRPRFGADGLSGVLKGFKPAVARADDRRCDNGIQQRP